MKIIFFTRKMDKFDDRMGAYHDYVCRLAKKCEKVIVICLEKRHVDFPSNVEVYSMGREHGFSSIRCALNAQKIFLKCVPKVDAIFCHMNPIYTIMIAPFAKLFRKPIVTWYGHVAVTPKLKLMDFLTDVVVTSDKSAYRVSSKKVKYIGHGIDTQLFKSKKVVKKNTIVWLGRITRVKKIEQLIEASRILVHEKRVPDLKVIIGGVPSGDCSYFRELKSLVKKGKLEDTVRFVGKVPNILATDHYNRGKISVSMVVYGGAGKTNLEAMACERPLITCSAAFENIITKYRSSLFFRENDVKDLADKIQKILLLPPKNFEKIKQYLRLMVVEKFDTDSFLDRLLEVCRTEINKKKKKRFFGRKV